MKNHLPSPTTEYDLEYINCKTHMYALYCIESNKADARLNSVIWHGTEHV